MTDPEQKAAGQAREAVRETLIEQGYFEPRSYGLQSESEMTAEATLLLGGEVFSFDLTVTPEDDGWAHVGYVHTAFGEEAHVRYHSEPGTVPPPEKVARDLDRRLREDRAFEDYMEAKAHCGPGEEPDMDKWRQSVVEATEKAWKDEQDEVFEVPYEKGA